MTEPLVAALVVGALTGLGGLLVPRLIARVPEPPETAGVPEPTPAYADIAAAEGLGARSAVLSAGAGALLAAAVGWAWPLLYLTPTVPFGVALSVIDWRTMRLPTWLLAPAYPVLVVLVVLCAVLSGDYDDLRRAGLGWLVMGGFYFVTNFVSPRLVGYGDVRLAGLLGIALGYLGWATLLVGMYAAFAIFAVPALVLSVVRRDTSMLRMRMPFGPAMLAGGALGVLAGEPLVSAYLRSRGTA